MKLDNLGFDAPVEQLLEAARKGLGVWKRLIHITGGELELSKCCFSLMTWKLHKGTEVLCNIDEAPGSLSLQSEKYTGLTVDIKRQEVTAGERILGVRLALAGGDTDEYDFRLKQAKTLAGKIGNSPLSRWDAETIYRERWLSSVGYCLPVTQFTDGQCDKIQSPVYMQLLPKKGFNRHHPRAVIFGPTKYQSKGLATFSVLQYTLHLERFIGYLRHQNHEGNLLRIQMDQHQQLIGSGAHFLSLPNTEYPYGEDSRIQFLWDNNTEEISLVVLVP